MSGGCVDFVVRSRFYARKSTLKYDHCQDALPKVAGKLAILGGISLNQREIIGYQSGMIEGLVLAVFVDVYRAPRIFMALRCDLLMRIDIWMTKRG